jgi:lantibiotic leader peptide-processing serine protease
VGRKGAARRSGRTDEPTWRSEGNSNLREGTSMAWPHVPGVAALIISQAGKKMSPGQVKAVIERTAEPQPCPMSLLTDNSVSHIPYLAVLGVNSKAVQVCDGGADDNSRYGHGQLNALSAVSG